MASRTPIEVWEKILKCTISVSLYFESDPASACSVDEIQHYYDEAEYWKSERIRNKLKRVCRSWKAFLASYDHRYVRMTDVYHQRIPVTAIPLAVRLNIGTNWKCVCANYCNQVGGLRRDKVLSILKAECNSREHITWRTEILDGQLPEYRDDFTLLFKRMPSLEAIVHCAEYLFANLRAYPKTLKNLSIPGVRLLYPLQPLHPVDTLSFPHLTTLHIPLWCLQSPCAEWSMPSLRHLSIRYYSLMTPGWQNILSLLERIGANLFTFYLHHDSVIQHEVSSADLWRLIPCVERIEIPYWGLLCPPEDHPVHYARVSVETLMQVGISAVDDPSSVIPWLPKWGMASSKPDEEQCSHTYHRAMVVYMDVSWLWYLTDRDTVPKILPLWIAEFYLTRGIRFTDSEGVTLHEYLIFIITWYWKRGRARYRLRGAP